MAASGRFAELAAGVERVPPGAESAGDAASVGIHQATSAKGTSGTPSIRGPSRAKKGRKGRRASSASAADDVDEAEEVREAEEMDETDAETRTDEGGEGGEGARGRRRDGDACADDGCGPDPTPLARSASSWGGVASGLRSIMSGLGGGRRPPTLGRVARVGQPRTVSLDHPQIRAYRELDVLDEP